jgi:hypothetical protein
MKSSKNGKLLSFDIFLYMAKTRGSRHLLQKQPRHILSRRKKFTTYELDAATIIMETLCPLFTHAQEVVQMLLAETRVSPLHPCLRS